MDSGDGLEFEPSARLQPSLSHNLLIKWCSKVPKLSPEALMYPVFIVEDENAKEEIPSMPNVFRYGVKTLISELKELIDAGLKSVLLFGVISTLKKDEKASNADSPSNPVIKALPLLRSTFPDLLLACDVCMCPYSSHGHCGILKENGKIDNDASIVRLAQISLAYVKAGCQLIAPSDMMDGRVGAIKELLREAGREVPVLSYSAKFCSAFYGPFRDAAKSAPSFGDRRAYQLPPASRELALRACERDIDEGADMLMVKPGMPYLDIIQLTKEAYPNHPLFVYQVSGEYAMLIHAASMGTFDLQKAVLESITSFQRAGADCIITYFTPLLLKWMKEPEK